jgi:hypothetical protein
MEWFHIGPNIYGGPLHVITYLALWLWNKGFSTIREVGHIFCKRLLIEQNWALVENLNLGDFAELQMVIV